MEGKSCVIVCRCRAELVSSETLETLMAGLKLIEYDIIELDDLCALSLKEKAILTDIAGEYTFKIVIACYPRAVKSILEQGGIEFGKYQVINFREFSASQILSETSKNINNLEGKADPVSPESNPGLNSTPGKLKFRPGKNARVIETKHQVYVSGLEMPAWFPVIDKQRCSLCGKCANFCMFGVYKFDKKTLKVANPLSCKNNCPACGRLCPESAVIFPRWPDNSVLSGEEPGSKTKPSNQENMLDQLTDRNRKRKIIFRQDFVSKVEREHLKAVESIRNNQRNNGSEKAPE